MKHNLSFLNVCHFKPINGIFICTDHLSYIDLGFPGCKSMKNKYLSCSEFSKAFKICKDGNEVETRLIGDYRLYLSLINASEI